MRLLVRRAQARAALAAAAAAAAAINTTAAAAKAGPAAAAAGGRQQQLVAEALADYDAAIKWVTRVFLLIRCSSWSSSVGRVRDTALLARCRLSVPTASLTPSTPPPYALLTPMVLRKLPLSLYRTGTCPPARPPPWQPLPCAYHPPFLARHSLPLICRRFPVHAQVQAPWLRPGRHPDNTSHLPKTHPFSVSSLTPVVLPIPLPCPCTGTCPPAPPRPPPLPPTVRNWRRRCGLRTRQR